MKNKDLIILVLADIHLGILDVDYQYTHFEENIMDKYRDNPPDIIVLAGDTMHSRVSMNSRAALVFNMIIDDLISLGSTILLINGTKSHDDDQIKSVSHRVNDKFRIYTTVTSDVVLGLNLLIIPEEYMVDPDEYYEDYLNRKYDYIFGHGNASHMAYSGKVTTIKRLTSPMWDYDKSFAGIVDRAVVFGHFHKHDVYKKYISCGSFGRYNHGEEEPKGYLKMIHRRKVTDIEQIVNKNTKEFITVLESELPANRDEMMVILSEYIDSGVYKLRITLDREIDDRRLSDITSFYKKHLNVSINREYTRKIRKKLAKEKNKDLVESSNKYDGMDSIDATIEYLYEIFKYKMEKTHLNKIINNDLEVSR